MCAISLLLSRSVTAPPLHLEFTTIFFFPSFFLSVPGVTDGFVQLVCPRVIPSFPPRTWCPSCNQFLPHRFVSHCFWIIIHPSSLAVFYRTATFPFYSLLSPVFPLFSGHGFVAFCRSPTFRPGFTSPFFRWALLLPL